MQRVALYVGSLRRLDDEGQWSGIFKSWVEAPLMLGIHGLAGDRQADRQADGGPEKFIHPFPGINYLGLALSSRRFPNS
jgi:MOSC domain-containing protein YiiM